MTSRLENQKCILTKENIRRRRFRFRKNNEADKTSDPIQSNPCPTLSYMSSVVIKF